MVLPKIRAITGYPAVIGDVAPFASELGSYTIDPAARVIGNSNGFALALTTFSGFGCQVGQIQNFDSVTFRILAADSTNYAVTLIGTQGTGSNKHEGYGGKTVSWFYTDVTSPMVFSGAFNFAQYLTANSLTMSSGDSVFILLGINDVFSATSDSSLATTMATMVTQLNAMITNIQAAVSGVKVWIGLTIPPSAEQDSFGDNYFCGQTRDRYAWNVASWREQVIIAFDARTASNVYIAPIALNLDTVNNMQTTTEAVNARNSTTVTRQNNGVHPASYGYQQNVDSLYCCLMSLES